LTCLSHFARIVFRHLNFERTDKMIMDLEHFVKSVLGKKSRKRKKSKKKVVVAGASE